MTTTETLYARHATLETAWNAAFEAATREPQNSPAWCAAMDRADAIMAQRKSVSAELAADYAARYGVKQ